MAEPPGPVTLLEVTAGGATGGLACAGADVGAGERGEVGESSLRDRRKISSPTWASTTKIAKA